MDTKPMRPLPSAPLRRASARDVGPMALLRFSYMDKRLTRRPSRRPSSPSLYP